MRVTWSRFTTAAAAAAASVVLITDLLSRRIDGVDRYSILISRTQTLYNRGVATAGSKYFSTASHANAACRQGLRLFT